MKNTILAKFGRSTALGATLAFSATLGHGVQAQTQSQSDNDDGDFVALEQIVVTGTRRLDRTIADSAVPIDVLTAADLNRQGFTETNQILANLLPSFNFPLPSITDGTDTTRPATLRGLGLITRSFW
ncbi:hypothetical protein JCM17846_12600 [Iodidimonas nitroreducens]|uniref:TonB-dependent receptor plug domain-containing protein n=1 Tax=Iodidimonas nitroreducens TaxID=1236968 RepID=A0A5A7N664_9PROT|nr:TonB-dependent receptor plug domain-containing protein [Iodidimonas nitroreducens]GER03578.1 hypothetical protein JCM17846_12600 [Iodidimonas nitroreducens]